MSLKAPRETAEYQSHHHCQCDFCNSRRNVNAKKWTVGRRCQMLQHAQLRNGCCCKCHDDLTQCHFAKGNNPTDFDPNYPVPVNQTALNAARGRNGLAVNGNGDKFGKTKDEEAQDALNDLDRLERLLILEHKARVKDSLEADRLGMLRRTGKDLRPEPLPPGYQAGNGAGCYGGNMDGGYGGPENGGVNGSQRYGSNYVGDSQYPGALGDGVDPETIREAYVLAHRCPVTPPPQCRASHRLQDTLDDVRLVTMDPINPANRRSLRRLLHSNGIGSGDGFSDEDSQTQLSTGGAAAGGRAGQGKPVKNTLAGLRTTTDHPQGTGVVWYKGLKFGDVVAPGQTNGCCCGNPDLTPGAAAAVSVRKEENLGPVGVKKVTYMD